MGGLLKNKSRNVQLNSSVTFFRLTSDGLELVHKLLLLLYLVEKWFEIVGKEIEIYCKTKGYKFMTI